MQAIILSAGQGSRLGELVNSQPKCLIDLRGETWGEVNFPVDDERARELTAKWYAKTKTVAA